MRKPDITYKKLVLVCLNERTDGKECCLHKRAQSVYDALKRELAAIDPNIRVSRTGCLGNCLSGVSVVIMPDNIWLGEVTAEDVPEIIKMMKLDSALDIDALLEL